ncbi:hypothetical protein XarbCFBP7610_10175 [Xanthomonas arboricola]|nr:hypothetical protein XarbCFBP7610_10175 [Xanthomonas arboricola]
MRRVLRWWASKGPAAKQQINNQSQVSPGCGVLTARGTRRESIRGGSVAASMPPHGPAIGEDTAPDS